MKYCRKTVEHSITTVCSHKNFSTVVEVIWFDGMRKKISPRLYSFFHKETRRKKKEAENI